MQRLKRERKKPSIFVTRQHHPQRSVSLPALPSRRRTRPSDRSPEAPAMSAGTYTPLIYLHSFDLVISINCSTVPWRFSSCQLPSPFKKTPQNLFRHFVLPALVQITTTTLRIISHNLHTTPAVGTDKKHSTASLLSLFSFFHHYPIP